MPFLNASFYCFSQIQDPDSAAAQLKWKMEALPIKGTIILAEEGINGFLAGEAPIMREALDFLKKSLDLKNFWAKESISETIPFQKLCFKVKEEIVTFRVPGFEIEKSPAPYLKPEELASWYEKGEDFLILDTRNEYEVRLGTFEKAKSLNIDHFVDFPKALEDLGPEWKQKKIVTFCTGGIRCEKAAPYLRSQGLEAYQLEGGIIHYFEKMGGKNWKGECFVFDERIALNPALEATGATLCPHCQGPNPRGTLKCMHCNQ
jgi:UPF0176 protein